MPSIATTSRLAVLSVVALLTLPALARADAQIAVVPVAEFDNRPAVVFVDDDRSSETHFTLTKPYGDTYLAFQHDAAVSVGSGCQLEPGKTGSGVCTAPFTAVLMDAKGGDDKVSMTLWLWNNQLQVEAVPGVVLAGPGNDDVLGDGPPADDPSNARPAYGFEGGAGDDQLRGDTGDDSLSGGEGADLLLAKEGTDEVLGGPGNDTVSAGLRGAGDVLDGGDGFDSIPTIENNDYRRTAGAELSVTEDGLANDGEPGENDNVTGVESLELHAGAVTFTGTPGGDAIFVQANRSNISGLGGNDTLTGWDGHDRLDGGDGDDKLEGGFGDDQLIGGAGTDSFRGDRIEPDVLAANGADDIQARDGIAETIECGIGTDSVNADAVDRVDSTCENVTRDGRVVPPDLDPKRPDALSELGRTALQLIGRPNLRSLLARGLRFRVACKERCTVAGELRLGRRKLGTARAQGSGTVKLTIKVGPRSRRHLARLQRAKLTLVARVTPAGGKPVRLTRRFVARR